ncbi:mechanosensitive ion channel family protein [Desulfovibrio gilichinskyi]|uniref:Small conductance mechanosensitive channel n=1 Tax=Desulfovibrio gilichinskyi TaxID=1519643 RepID=A0A1X7CVZ4_9BACT|nr:mechanosensitive ion channel domain-containing protein [Desulfovibrio gilichinskyi]SMF04182.1 small conductance mechanosensitive channel [Desulfovibrio gilichinskyi]
MNATGGIIGKILVDSNLDKQLDFLQPDFLRGLLEQSIGFVSLYGVRLLVAILVLFVGKLFARQASSLISRVMGKAKVDDILTSFIQNIVYYVMLAAFVVAALGQAGINITSFLAVLGAAGLAVGLALKDTLSNFAAGVMLIILRLFKKGDYVTIAGTSGTVQSLSAFYTELSTPDNQKVVVPNSSILNTVIINTTAHKTRRIDLVIGIGYEDDIPKAKEILAQILSENTTILKSPAPTIVVGELGDSSINLLVRPWVRTADYWTVRWDLLEGIKITLDKAGISIPYPQTDVHLYKEDSES